MPRQNPKGGPLASGSGLSTTVRPYKCQTSPGSAKAARLLLKNNILVPFHRERIIKPINDLFRITSWQKDQNQRHLRLSASYFLKLSGS